MKNLFFAAIIITTAIFCKNSTPLRVQEVDFYIRFLQDQQEVNATAAFRAGENGSKLAPRTVQSVYFNDAAMAERKLGELVRYQGSHLGGFETTYKFKWKNDANATLTQSAQTSPILSVEMPQPWPKTEFAPIKWQGAPLKKGENLVVLCENEAGESVSQEFFGPTDLPLVPFVTKKLKPGKWSATLVKTQVETKIVGSTTTNIVFDFYTAPVSFVVN